MKNEQLKVMVHSIYDLQKLRIQMGNRIVVAIKSRDLRMDTTKPEELSDEDSRKYLARIRADYKKVMDGLKSLPPPKKFKGMGVISTYTELVLFDEYLDIENSEEKAFRLLGKTLEDIPVWTRYLKSVKGIGPAIGGCLISEIDIEKAKYPSSLWKYAGLDVVRVEDENGVRMEGRSRKADHLVKVRYVTKKGATEERNSITFNPFLKTKLMGVLAPSFLRVGIEKSSYARIYYDYKHRMENRPDLSEDSKGHIHYRSLRYMIKIFLMDLYCVWRELEGLPVSSPYSEGKLGIVHTSH